MIKSILKGLLPILLTVIAVIMIIAGEIDDAPGLGGLGLIILGLASYINVKKYINK